MEQFLDVNGQRVRLVFQQSFFSKTPEHVLVICKYHDQWLMTKHAIRGIEFPGGKREIGETLEEAATREVKEETGAVIKSLKYIGEYEVLDQSGPFVKAIFYAIIERIEPQDDYFETEGPILIGENVLDLRFGDEYSFIMKDSVVEKSIQFILQIE